MAGEKGQLQPTIPPGSALAKRFERVIKMYEKLIQLGQSDAQLYHNLSDCYMKWGKFSHAAEDVLHKTFEREPENQDVVHFLFQHYLRSSRKDKQALQIYERCLPHDPHNLQLLELMEAAYTETGQADRARHMTRVLAETASSKGELNIAIDKYMTLYQQEAEKTKARRALIPLLFTYLQRHAEDIYRRILLGQLLQEEGRLAEAKKELVTAREQALHRKEQESLRTAKYTLGLCFAAEGLHAAAAEEIGEAVGGLPVSTETVDLFYALAQAYEQSGQHEQAKKTYNAILQFWPTYRDVEERLRRIDTRPSSPPESKPRQPSPVFEGSIGDWETVYSSHQGDRRRYEILQMVGRGRMGVVYEAFDTEMKARVALKMMAPDLSQNPKALENFIREAQIAFKLNHPNIVRIYNRGEENEQHYIAMEYVEGITLRNLLNQRGKLALDEVLMLVYGICQGLQYAHTFIDPDSRKKTPVIHRDLKPENIMLQGVTAQESQVTMQTIPKILDFGLSRVLTDSQLSSGSMTKGISGTYGYMAPEQFDTLKTVDARADIYALGVTVYELCTGSRPFTGENPAQLMFATLSLEPKPPSEYDTTLPRWLDTILLKCLAKFPEKRYQNALEFQQALVREWG